MCLNVVLIISNIGICQLFTQHFLIIILLLFSFWHLCNNSETKVACCCSTRLMQTNGSLSPIMFNDVAIVRFRAGRDTRCICHAFLSEIIVSSSKCESFSPAAATQDLLITDNDDRRD